MPSQLCAQSMCALAPTSHHTPRWQPASVQYCLIRNGVPAFATQGCTPAPCLSCFQQATFFACKIFRYERRDKLET